MDTIAIFGVGLIGGSFALALRKSGFTGTILGVGSEATLNRARQLHIIDSAASVREAAEQADVLYLAQPVRVILETLLDLNRWIRPGVLVTDAGSTKAAIVHSAAQSLTKAQFLGGHPLAGKETRGLDSADAELFRGRTYVLTPLASADLTTPAARDFRMWLERIGSVPVVLNAEEHDRTVALTSHLPQLASIALGMLLSDRGCVDNGAFGPALLDSTRLALSPYEVWADILSTNALCIDSALAGYIQAVEQLRRDLNGPGMRDHFRSASSLAKSVRSAGNPEPEVS